MKTSKVIVRCRICNRPLKNEESIRLGAGRICRSHEPPEWVSNHPIEKVKKMGLDAYGSGRSAAILIREGQQYDALYLAHLAVEKMIKTLKVDKTGIFHYGHNLPDLLKEVPLDGEIPEWMKDYLADLNHFQTAGRYPTEKENQIASTDLEFLKNAISDMEKVMSWLSIQLSSRTQNGTSKN